MTITTHHTSTTTHVHSHEARGGRAGVVRRVYGPLFRRETWIDTAALLVALPAGVAWFSLAVTGLSVAAGLMITVVGLPILVGLLHVARRMATIERTATAGLLSRGIEPHPPTVNRDATWWTRTRSVLRDRPAWRGVAYALVSLPVGITTFTTALVLWSTAVACTAFPAFQAFMSDTDRDELPTAFEWALEGWGRVGFSAGVGVAGLVLLALTPRIVHPVASAQRRLATRLLSPTGWRG